MTKMLTVVAAIACGVSIAAQGAGGDAPTRYAVAYVEVESDAVGAMRSAFDRYHHGNERTKITKCRRS
jgi:hypothetical protein